jgi:hypothetical protein
MAPVTPMVINRVPAVMPMNQCNWNQIFLNMYQWRRGREALCWSCLPGRSGGGRRGQPGIIVQMKMILIDIWRSMGGIL